MAKPAKPAARAVIGVPTYNGVQRGYFAEALESLLAQTYPHVAFVFVDDCSSDDTADVVARVAATDPRVVLRRSPTRLGIVKNWRRTFEVARELFPDATYFAWGSDHDRWHHKWLKKLVKELDGHQDAAMAYTRYTWIDERGEEFKKKKAGLVTRGLSRRERFAAASVSKIHAGNLVYGLYRADLLERVGVYPLVYRPDVLHSHRAVAVRRNPTRGGNAVVSTRKTAQRASPCAPTGTAAVPIDHRAHNPAAPGNFYQTRSALLATTVARAARRVALLAAVDSRARAASRRTCRREQIRDDTSVRP